VSRPTAFISELARRELSSDWLTVRLVADYVKNTNQFDRLKGFVCDAVAYPVAFKNVLKIALMCSSKPDALKDIPYERHDLSGLVFNQLDLEGVSFRGCNLTDVEYHTCNMKSVVLNEAIIKNTGFFTLQSDSLQGVDVGDFKRFFSIRVDRNRMIDNHDEARKWFQQRTKMRIEVIEPCDSALQLRSFFNKLVYPDGTVRRSLLGRRGMLSGKRFHSSSESVLEAAIRHGYLIQEERYRDRIHRPEGQLYSELVEFATNLRMTSGIKALLDDVCEKEGCLHIPPIQ
jgi:hypothetical protein